MDFVWKPSVETVLWYISTFSGICYLTIKSVTLDSIHNSCDVHMGMSAQTNFNILIWFFKKILVYDTFPLRHLYGAFMIIEHLHNRLFNEKLDCVKILIKTKANVCG